MFYHLFRNLIAFKSSITAQSSATTFNKLLFDLQVSFFN